MSSSSVETSGSKGYPAGTTLPETSASSALSTRPNSSLIRPSSSEPCERSPVAPTCSNCAQRPDILLAPMLPEPPLSVCAARSAAGASPFRKATSTATSRERASFRNMPARSATMSGSSSPCSLRSRASTSRSTEASMWEEAGTHLSSTTSKSSGSISTSSATNPSSASRVRCQRQHRCLTGRNERKFALALTPIASTSIRTEHTICRTLTDGAWSDSPQVYASANRSFGYEQNQKADKQKC